VSVCVSVCLEEHVQKSVCLCVCHCIIIIMTYSLHDAGCRKASGISECIRSGTNTPSAYFGEHFTWFQLDIIHIAQYYVTPGATTASWPEVCRLHILTSTVGGTRSTNRGLFLSALDLKQMLTAREELKRPSGSMDAIMGADSIMIRQGTSLWCFPTTITGGCLNVTDPPCTPGRAGTRVMRIFSPNKWKAAKGQTSRPYYTDPGSA
jgi:hypothetical protein